MTYEQYWYQDCYLVQAYRKAQEYREKRIDQMLWQGGAYIYDTMLRVSPAYNPFVKKGTKVQPYIQKPFSATQEEKVDEATEKQKAENERLKSILFFKNWARAAQAHFKE